MNIFRLIAENGPDALKELEAERMALDIRRADLDRQILTLSDLIRINAPMIPTPGVKEKVSES